MAAGLHLGIATQLAEGLVGADHNAVRVGHHNPQRTGFKHSAGQGPLPGHLLLQGQGLAQGQVMAHQHVGHHRRQQTAHQTDQPHQAQVEVEATGGEVAGAELDADQPLAVGNRHAHPGGVLQPAAVVEIEVVVEQPLTDGAVAVVDQHAAAGEVWVVEACEHGADQIADAQGGVGPALQAPEPFLFAAERSTWIAVDRLVDQRSDLLIGLHLLPQPHRPAQAGLAGERGPLHGLPAGGFGIHVEPNGAEVAPIHRLQVDDGRGQGTRLAWAGAS